MEGVHLTTQAGLQVAAVASTQAFQLADIILDFLEGAFRPYLAASRTLECLPQFIGHVVHQVHQADAVQVPHTLHHSQYTEDVDLEVLPMEL